MDDVLGLIAQEQVDQIGTLFDELASDPNTADWIKEFLQVVITILNGSRETSSADDPALSFSNAAEILFLIERLGK